MFVVLDLVFRMDTYVSAASEAGLGVWDMATRILSYELLAVPILFIQVAPFVTVIASMFALTRLMSANEVVPMLFVGRSVRRVLLPMVVLAGGSGLVMAATWQWVVPQVRADYEDAKLFLRGKGGALVLHTIALRSPRQPEIELFAYRYLIAERKLEGVVLYERAADELQSHYIGAESAVWDGARGDWKLVEGYEIVVVEGVTEVRPRAFLGVESITPKLVVQSEKEKKGAALLSYQELRELLTLRSDRTDYRLAMHRHWTAPLSNLVLLLLALPFGLRFERGSRIEFVLMAMGLCALFMLSEFTCQNLVFRGSMHPVIGAWAPTIVFGSLAAVMFGGVKT